MNELLKFLCDNHLRLGPVDRLAKQVSFFIGYRFYWVDFLENSILISSIYGCNNFDNDKILLDHIKDLYEVGKL